MNKEYYNKEVNTVLNDLNSKKNGLSSVDVLNRLKINGYNELPKNKDKSIIKIFLEELISPLEIILLVTVILSFFIGEVFDAFVLLFIILVDVIIGTVEEAKAKKDANNLLNMIKVITKVLRDGQKMVVDSKTIVSGDIMLLESGDKIVADDRIIDSYNLSIDE